MLRTLLALLCLLPCLSSLSQDSPTLRGARLTLGMKTGALVRLHVVAEDDTPAAQALKIQVRDAVLEAFAQGDFPGLTMYDQAQAALPDLWAAAREAAGAQAVTVTLEDSHFFEQRAYEDVTIPAGEYPALMVRLGRAQGRNWWGLLLADWQPKGELRWLFPRVLLQWLFPLGGAGR